jgi:L-iditol 2-dehydrogenase
MIQQVMVKPGEIEYREVPVPEIGPKEVLLRIEKIGICGSDIHVYHGEHPFTTYPVTQGHEASGVVVKTGGEVKDLKVGMRVTLQPQIVCGACYPCTHGKYNLCEKLKVFGFQTPGVASEYFAIEDYKITPLPDSLSLDDGAMIEPLAVAVHGVMQAGDLSDKNVCVIGAGPIGNLFAQVAKGMGARKVLITDVSDYRLELAKQCGVDYTANTINMEFGQALMDCFGPDKADIIFDCAGNNVTINQAIHCARKGSKILLIAVFAGQANVDLAVLNDKELELNTSMMYRSEHYEKAIQLAAAGKVQLKPLVTKHFSFRKFSDAYEYIDANREKTMKIIINVQE